MLWIDAFLRIGAITLLLLGAILVIRDRICWRPTVFIVLAAIGISIMLIGSAPENLGIPPLVQSTAYIFEFVSIVFIWWFGLALFRDDFTLHWPHWLFFILCGALRVPHNIAEMTGNFVYPVWLDTLCELIVVAMMVHLIFTVIKEGEDDLIQSRRRSRKYFIMAVVAAVLLSTFPGHRNFSAFLNSYRIDAIKEEFKDPQKSRTPILTLAMDVGYNSLAPFNKAFRESENMTPTTYRQNVLAQADG